MHEFVWLDDQEALALHERLLALHGGAAGVRDPGLLNSALARPRQHVAYAESASVITLAASLAAGVIQNHPFVDGNKRTGFLLGVLFLELNGYAFTATQADAANAVINLASGNLDEAGYAEFLAANSHPVSNQR